MIKGKVIAIDFDGTITTENTYPYVGKFRPNAIEAIKKIQENNFCFLFTCRQGRELTEVLDVLKENGINIGINSKYDFEVAFGRKPIADYYIDDRALFVGEIDWFKIEKFFME